MSFHVRRPHGTTPFLRNGITIDSSTNAPILFLPKPIPPSPSHPTLPLPLSHWHVQHAHTKLKPISTYQPTQINLTKAPIHPPLRLHHVPLRPCVSLIRQGGKSQFFRDVERDFILLIVIIVKHLRRTKNPPYIRRPRKRLPPPPTFHIQLLRS